MVEEGLGLDGIYTVIVLTAGMILLLIDYAGPDFVFMGMLAFLLLPQVITLNEGLEGFSSSAPLTVAVLFVVACGVSETGGLDHVFGRVLGRPSSVVTAMGRMLLPIAIVSAFMNNTPVVAIMIPIIMSWSQKADLPSKQLLIPLSFASMLGGTCTLIGTSTNLVVAGLQEKRGLGHPGFFDIGKYGVPVAIFGIVYIMIFTPILLPSGKKATISSRPSAEFMVGMSVSAKSHAVGKSINDAGFEKIEGLYLTCIRRDKTTIYDVGADLVVMAGDILFFTGTMDNLQSIADAYALEPITDEHEEEFPAMSGAEKEQNRAPKTAPGGHSSALEKRGSKGRSSNSWSTEPLSTLFQATVRFEAPVVGMSVREVKFRQRFHATVVSVSRHGSLLHGKLGDIVLNADDLIVMDAKDDFDESLNEVEANLENIHRVGSHSDREFVLAMKIVKGGLAENLTVEDVGLVGLPQLFLVEIERKSGERIPTPAPNVVLHSGDILWFVGALESVAALQKIPGLAPRGGQSAKLTDNRLDRRLVQVVISPKSRLAGKTVRDSRFRTKFNAAIIGVHRQGERLKEKAKSVTLRGGDVLLIDAGPNFVAQHRNDRNFALVSEVANSAKPRFERALISSLILAAMIASQLIGVAMGKKLIDLFTASVFAAGLMLLTKCLSGDAARASIKWDVIITIAAAFGISTAMENSDVAAVIARAMVSSGSALGGNFFIMVALYLTTMFLSNVVANNAVAALMFPIAATISADNDIPFDRMSALLMLAASSAFMSPFGYQTNLMVYGAGGYTMMDFVKFGVPMQIWQMAVSIAVIFLDEIWPIVWAVSFAVGILVICAGQLHALISHSLKQKGGSLTRKKTSEEEALLPVADPSAEV